MIDGYLTFIFEPVYEIQTWWGWGTLLTGGSLMSATLNKKRVLYWIILFHVIDGHLTFFWTRQWNSNLIRLRNASDGWGPQCQPLSTRTVCYIGFILFPLDCWLLEFFSNTPINFHCWRVGPMSASMHKKMCVMFDYFVTCDCGLLDFYFRTRPGH
jgi:hypothetical protein